MGSDAMIFIPSFIRLITVWKRVAKFHIALFLPKPSQRLRDCVVLKLCQKRVETWIHKSVSVGGRGSASTFKYHILSVHLVVSVQYGNMVYVMCDIWVC
jgi:hypothetical protein